MRPSDRAWITLGLGVVTYDLLAAPEETLSEGVDRYMLRYPWITRGIAFALAAHVCNLVPARRDPVHLLFAALRGNR